MGIIHSKKHVTNLDQECIQPNAVDLRIQDIFHINGRGTDGKGWLEINETSPKQFIDRLPCFQWDDSTYLEPGECYDIVSQHNVTIPEGMVGWLVIRSTFARNGCLLGNGLYDSGYVGSIGGILHNLSRAPIQVSRGVRFAQFIMASAETSHGYNGYYNTQGGTSV
jgi:dUTP pyrophosphatase